MSIGSYDPLRQFGNMGQVKNECIYVFSGFNDHKLLQCEVYNTVTRQWTPIAHIKIPRTKFAAVALSKMKILIFGGKQADGQRTAEIEEYNVKQNLFKTLPFKL